MEHQVLRQPNGPAPLRRGRHDPTLTMIEKLAKALKAGVEELLK
jgi:hypothetical protein